MSMLTGILGDDSPGGPVAITTSWDPAHKHTGVSLTTGNREAYQNNNYGSPTAVRATTGQGGGLRQVEFQALTSGAISFGLADGSFDFTKTGAPGQNGPAGAGSPNSLAGASYDGRYIWANGGATDIGIRSLAAGHYLSLIADLDLNKFWVMHDGAIIAGDPSAGTGGYAIPAGTIYPFACPSSLGGNRAFINCGNEAFAFPYSGALPWG